MHIDAKDDPLAIFTGPIAIVLVLLKNCANFTSDLAANFGNLQTGDAITSHILELLYNAANKDVLQTLSLNIAKNNPNEAAILQAAIATSCELSPHNRIRSIEYMNNIIHLNLEFMQELATFVQNVNVAVQSLIDWLADDATQAKLNSIVPIEYPQTKEMLQQLGFYTTEEDWLAYKQQFVEQQDSIVVYDANQYLYLQGYQGSGSYPYQGPYPYQGQHPYNGPYPYQCQPPYKGAYPYKVPTPYHVPYQAPSPYQCLYLSKNTYANRELQQLLYQALRKALRKALRQATRLPFIQEHLNHGIYKQPYKGAYQPKNQRLALQDQDTPSLTDQMLKKKNMPHDIKARPYQEGEGDMFNVDDNNSMKNDCLCGLCSYCKKCAHAVKHKLSSVFSSTSNKSAQERTAYSCVIV